MPGFHIHSPALGCTVSRPESRHFAFRNIPCLLLETFLAVLCGSTIGEDEQVSKLVVDNFKEETKKVAQEFPLN